jgi:hypothetical protein
MTSSAHGAIDKQLARERRAEARRAERERRRLERRERHQRERAALRAEHGDLAS